MQVRAAARDALDLVDPAARPGRQPVEVAVHVHLDALPLELRRLALHVCLQQTHERVHLALRAIPVLGGEGEQREDGHAGLDAPFDDLADRRHAGGVTLVARQAAGARPATVAVHDDGDVAGQTAAELQALEQLVGHVRLP
jgi:hypothetical protein